MADKILSAAVTVPSVLTNPVNVVSSTRACVKYSRDPSAMADVVVPTGKYPVPSNDPSAFKNWLELPPVTLKTDALMNPLSSMKIPVP